MCKLEGIKWLIIESIKPLTKTQQNIIAKHRFSSGLMEWYTSDDKKETMLKGIEKAKIKGKLIEITDRQFGKCLNFYGNSKIKDTTPLKYTYCYKNEDRTMLIPLTTKQLKSIITL